MYQKVSSLEGQGTIGGGPEDTFGDEEALHSVWKKTKGVWPSSHPGENL